MEKITRLPKHVAFIMDGNGRWAERHGLSRLEGHRAGVENALSLVANLGEHRIKYATLYAFSTENWRRPRGEVAGLFRLLSEVIDRECSRLHREGVRLRHIGRLDGLTPALQKSVTRAIDLTRNNTRMMVSLAFNYGGRLEILEAVRRLMRDGVPPAEIDEDLFGSYLYTAGLPDVDMVVRTGGEIRVSNFLMWQAAYSEYYFTPVLWPDFNKEELDKALVAYGQRQRRFGGLKGKKETE